jgi:hypothetical protein
VIVGLSRVFFYPGKDFMRRHAHAAAVLEGRLGMQEKMLITAAYRYVRAQRRRSGNMYVTVKPSVDRPLGCVPRGNATFGRGLVPLVGWASFLSCSAVVQVPDVRCAWALSEPLQTAEWARPCLPCWQGAMMDRPACPLPRSDPHPPAPRLGTFAYPDATTFSSGNKSGAQ